MDIDITFFYQTLCLLLFLGVLQRLLFTPLLNMLVRRDYLVNGVRQDIQWLSQTITEQQAAYDKTIQEAYEQARHYREGHRFAAKEEARQRIQKERETLAAQSLQDKQQRKQLEKQMIDQLEERVEDLSETLKDALLSTRKAA